MSETNWKAPHVQGSGRKLGLRDTYSPLEKRLQFQNGARFGKHNLESTLKRYLTDETFKAEADHAMRQPRKVDRIKHGISGRAAADEPMLNASKSSIDNGLRYRETDHKSRVAKGALHQRIVVKPVSRQAALFGYPGGNWGERLWSIYHLKYARGLVAVTENGLETAVFKTEGELHSAISKSGWEIARVV